MRGHRRVGSPDRHRDRPRRHRRHQAREGSAVGSMNLISSNIDRIVSLTISHVWLTLTPTILGLIIAVPLGWWAHRFKRGQAAIVGTAGLLYTIPSLALFIILPTILGTKILDPVNIVVSLALYTLALLLRVARDGLDALPHAT